MLVKQNLSITNTQPVRTRTYHVNLLTEPKKDMVKFENPNINKKPFIDRKIITPDKNINEFFNEISVQIFNDSKISHSFSNLLKSGHISLSSNAYANLKDPKSAIALQLDKKKSPIQHCAYLEEYLKNGVGVGINFSNLSNPIEEIKIINDYFKFRNPNLNRPSAGIALLNITHPEIMNFIGLKDNADYQNWCFDLSVIIDDEFLQKVDNNEDLILDNGTKINACQVYNKLLNSMKKSGEPGIIFSNNKNFLCDSCAAAELKENEGLNIGQINLSKFYNSQKNNVDYEFLSQSANVLAIALKKIAPNGFISILGYQDLLNKLEQNYGSKEALETLENSLKIIKQQAYMMNIRMAISPSGTISRILKTTPSIEPDINSNATYWDEIETMKIAQKYLEGGISKTFNLKKRHTIQDINLIIRNSQKAGIKGISVFTPSIQ